MVAGSEASGREKSVEVSTAVFQSSGFAERKTIGVFVQNGDAPPAFLPARPIAQADLAAVTERVRRRVVRWFRLECPWVWR